MHDIALNPICIARVAEVFRRHREDDLWTFLDFLWTFLDGLSLECLWTAWNGFQLGPRSSVGILEEALDLTVDLCTALFLHILRCPLVDHASTKPRSSMAAAPTATRS